MRAIECNERKRGRVLRFVRLAAVLGAFVGANALAAEVAVPLEPSLDLGVDKGAATFPTRLGHGLSATETSLFARDHAGGGYFLVHPKGDGTWQVAPVAAKGWVNIESGGFLLAESGTTYILNQDLTRSQVTGGNVTAVDEATGVPRWTAAWSGRTVENPAQVDGRVVVYTRERKVGTAAIVLDADGKEVQRLNLPFPWHVSAGVFTHGQEVWFHGLSRDGSFIVAVNPATGKEIWRENIGFGSTAIGFSGDLAVLHVPYDEGDYAVVDLVAHKVLKTGASRNVVERGMAVAGTGAYFWGRKLDDGPVVIRRLDLKTLKMQWERALDPGTAVVAGALLRNDRVWIMVQGGQGPTHLQALDPATGATVRDVALKERLALERGVGPVDFQGLFVVGTQGGRVLGYALPRD